jgi:hypothetical protein
MVAGSQVDCMHPVVKTGGEDQNAVIQGHPTTHRRDETLSHLEPGGNERT